MFDETDKDLIDTSLRETTEEIGLDRLAVDVWGRLNPLPGKVGLVLDTRDLDK